METKIRLLLQILGSCISSLGARPSHVEGGLAASEGLVLRLLH